MALLPIYTFPHSCLRKKAAPVTVFDTHLQQLIADMFETMYADDAVGLAATQVGVLQRVFVMDWSEDGSQPYCMVNPKIINQSGSQSSKEGCLSVPDIYATVERAYRVEITAQTVHAQPLSFTFEGNLAACIQHELDHLDGKLFVDYLSPIKRSMIEKKLRKAQKSA